MVTMSTQLESLFRHHLAEARHQPTAKRVRAVLDGSPVADSTNALLVWEPRRVTPQYAFPVGDIPAKVLAEAPAVVDTQRPVLHPGIPFEVHSMPGEPLSVAGKAGAGFKPDDPDLEGYVVLDFDAFDTWLEEDEPIVAHPRDPFHRIDTRRSSRHVVIRLDGQVVADSTRPTILFETNLPPRYYLPREDVVVDLRPSSKKTACAYKGQASYWSFDLDGKAIGDRVWSYEAPLIDAVAVKGLVAFFNEHFDIEVDGKVGRRPKTQWS
jgi:uncharacterized protein (DUF427 family)